ncbi:unnamed protein product [Trifolium pratense]|uniref:Uncharacterized protein n=1 Tax=Trifolium pratense TaxID=57577 RepID=A0ACB0KTC2_TRIPR|nr:unnamed protein product [Trifolium pratense]
MSKERYIPEGGSASRPPLFTGKNYYFWKNKMQLFLKSQEVGMWRIVTEGDYVPTVTSAEGVISDKPEDAWTTAEQQKVLLNSKAHLFLSCALSMEESERVDECDTAKKVWDTLQVHHEGTSHVKETRIDIGTNKFETFEMIENETIDEMFSRFTTIINELRSLGKTFSTNDRIRKLLRCLPVTWRPMVTAITQTKDLKTLPIEDLIGTLKAHEVILQGDKPLKKEKTIALKASQKDISFLEDDSKELEPTQEEAEGELALISGKIQRMLRRRDQIRRNFSSGKDMQKNDFDKSQVTCFGCNKLGHYKSECPLNKSPRNFPFKKKSMLATWDDDDEFETNKEEEEANICLMADSENDEVFLFDKTHPYEELETNFDSLLHDSEFLSKQCFLLQKEVSELKEEKKKLQIDILNFEKINKDLIESKEKHVCSSVLSKKIDENVVLKNEIKELRNDLTGFIKSTETFQNIMGSQSQALNKNGLGFNEVKNKIFENVLLPANREFKLRCSFCNKNGHHESICYQKESYESFYYEPKRYRHLERKNKHCSFCKNFGHLEKECYFKNKQIVKTNPQGPKSLWAPKRKFQNAGILSKCKEKAMVFGQWLFKTHDRR